jgi:hypothetical protein
MTPWLFIVVMYIFTESNYDAIAKIVEETWAPIAKITHHQHLDLSLNFKRLAKALWTIQ